MAGFRNLEKTENDSPIVLQYVGQRPGSGVRLSTIKSQITPYLAFLLPSFLVYKIRVIPMHRVVVYKGRRSLVGMPNLMSRIVRTKSNLLTCQTRSLTEPARNN